MTKSYKPTVGTISHAALRAADLMISFADELERIAADHPLVREAAAVQTLWAAGWIDIFELEMAAELVNDLQYALNEHAPPYCYFGTSEGDGSDFGFWPSMDAIEELPRIQNVDGEEIPDEDHAYVNDHGNVTVYGADGSVILELV